MVALAIDESKRLAELRRFRILDTERQAVFDDIAALARQLCNATVSLVCLIDEDRQWFLAEAGLVEVMGEMRETPREIAFCTHAIVSDEVTVVEDARQDERFKNNPLVTDYPHVRAYAGAPLVVGDGIKLGTVCVLDQEVRSFSEAELTGLRTLRDAAVAHLKQRLVKPDAYVSVCSWCQTVMEPLPSAEVNLRITHGICQQCAEEISDELLAEFVECPHCQSSISKEKRAGARVVTDEGSWMRCPDCGGSVLLK